VKDRIKFVKINETDQQVILNYNMEITNVLTDITSVSTKTKSFPKKN